ncbi:MAG TPA: thioredoxin domain-containing protein, partial [Planctomycetota bacterium]|nr:thioredoxin domain-containing protein [Planctomycetota bacterium]
MRSRIVLLVLGFAAACSPATSVQAFQEPVVRLPLPSPQEIAQLPADGGPEYNRLVFESSPYLLQHARNPVDWYPWGEAAFAAAKALDRPIFLSIGYSTCHWCHVMEHESFEDSEVAALMNAAFVCIKVDREERPDVDNVYMSFAQAFGGGGWLMTVLMTPEKVPFFAGTYIPKHARGGRTGMLDLIPKVQTMWNTRRADLLQDSERLLAFVRGQTATKGAGTLDAGAFRKARLALGSVFDAEGGGFGGPPKFPVPHNLRFLLREHALRGDAKSLAMVEKTLEAMRLGGIWDQVGFGFHRYSTDDKWLVPHFEKMLYDQALQMMAYTEAWQVSARPLWSATIEGIATYVLRDMTAPEGGFYSAEDADSEGVEGRFYVWSLEQLEAVLGETDAKFYADVYGCSERGNFQDEATGRRTGLNIPHLRLPLEQLAAGSGDPLGFMARVEALRKQLFTAREARVHPFKDDKILTDWNGLMIAALAKAGSALEREDWILAARRAAGFAVAKLRDPKTGRLFKRSRAGQAGLPGLLEDYAFLTWGLIELHQATQDPTYLRTALELTDLGLEFFWDQEAGGFWHSPSDGEALLLQSKEAYDGAIPSGNSVMLLNLVRLARLTGRTAYEERAQELVDALGGQVLANPSAHTQFLMGLDFLIGPTQEI